MRIAVISLFHPELTPGGAQQVAYDLFKGLDARSDVEAFFIASAGDSPRANVLRRPGAAITGFDSRPNEYLWWNDGLDYWLHRHRDPEPLLDFADLIAYLNLDIVSIHHFFRIGLEVPPLVARSTNAAQIMTLHEYMAVCPADGHLRRLPTGMTCKGPSALACHECIPHKSPEEIFIRRQWVEASLQWVDAFVAPSQAAVNALRRSGFPFPVEPIYNGIQQIPNRVSLDLAPPAKEVPLSAGRSRGQARPTRFGFFGQVLDDKGVATLLEAAEILRRDAKSPWTLEIYGGNLEYASEGLRSQLAAERERPDSEISFHGHYENQHVVDLMETCHWILIPSLWEETNSLVLSEARLARRPIIASDLGALGERILAGSDGILVSPANPEALAHAMIKAMAVDDWQDWVGRTPAVPTIGDMVEEYLALFRRLAPSESNDRTARL